MKFFIIIILISSYLTAHSAYLDDAQGTLGPSPQLYCLYSIRHNLSPKSVVPSISSLAPEIPIEDGEMYDLSISLPTRLCLTMEDILYAYEHDLFSQPLSVSEHFPNCIFGLSSRGTFAEYLLLEHGTYTWLSKQYARSSDLPYVNSFYILPYRKSIKFIETKVTAINCRVLTVS
jgi:hypothetical protein